MHWALCIFSQYWLYFLLYFPWTRKREFHMRTDPGIHGTQWEEGSNSKKKKKKDSAGLDLTEARKWSHSSAPETPTPTTSETGGKDTPTGRTRRRTWVSAAPYPWPPGQPPKLSGLQRRLHSGYGTVTGREDHFLHPSPARRQCWYLQAACAGTGLRSPTASPRLFPPCRCK